MDLTTQLAIRAVVRGLAHSPAIDDEHIRLIMEELSNAADIQRERGHRVDEAELLSLASDIGKDAKLVD